MIQVRRVYAPALPDEGERFLVDRLWPRGKTRESLGLAGWLKEAAPSTDLRHWYAHDPQKWEEFQHRYFAELDQNPATWKPLLEAARRGTITLLFSARESEHNNAVALRSYLEEHLKGA